MIASLARDGDARGIAEIIEHRDRPGRERQRKRMIGVVSICPASGSREATSGSSDLKYWQIINRLVNK